MNGKIFNIQRFSTSDGPGIRTTVFFKGCPLSCVWCHNPESHSAKNEIFYDARKCISCGFCLKACENSCHSFDNGHVYLRDNCEKCGSCASLCPSKAIEVCGDEKSADEVLDVVLRDLPFYEQSGGGITLSGGEPLMQYDFATEILKKAKEKQLHTAIETSGFCAKPLDEIAKYVDLWLFDIKLFDEDEHKRYTGVSNEKILENLRYLDDIEANIILRCPIIPDVNLKKEHFEKLSVLTKTLENVSAIHLEPYHPLGISKLSLLGKDTTFSNSEFLKKEELSDYADFLFKTCGIKTEIN